MDLTMIKGMPRSLSAEYEKRIAVHRNTIDRYEQEKKDIKKRAEELEKFRDQAQVHSGAFGVAAMFLQIAILLSSIAALMKKKLFWFIGRGAGAFGLVYFYLTDFFFL